MTREEKDKIILKLYEKRLSYLKGDIDEESYFSFVDKNTVDRLCTTKNGYKDLNSKLKATKNFINNYFKSIPSLENIDRLNELKKLEKKYNKNKKEPSDIEKSKEFVYQNYINYCKGIGRDDEANESIFIDVLDNFNYKSINKNSKITKNNALSTKYRFFKNVACDYYTKKYNKKRVDFLKYTNSLEENKKIKYLKKERKEEDILFNLRELLYTEYIKYLNDLISEEELIKIAKKNNINLFSISDNGFLTSNQILKTIEFQSNIYAKDIVGDLDRLKYLRDYGPRTSRLKKEGKVPLFNEYEIKIIKKIYNNFINYYDMKIDYYEYIDNESKLVEEINSYSRNFANKRKANYYIKYYLKNVMKSSLTINNIINNSLLYNKSFNIFRDFSYNKIDPDIKEFVDKYRVNIYNYAFLYAKENNLLDLFEEMDQRRKDILSGNYIENKNVNYKELLNDFINSKLYLEDFIVEKDINKKEFLNYIKYLKNSNDRLYVRYNSSIIGNKYKKDKYINNRINGLYTLVTKGIPSNKLNKNRKFKLLDFYLYCDKFLFNIDRLIKLSKDILDNDFYNEDYFELLKAINSNDKYINNEEIYNTNISYKGNIINKLDIDYIVDYINKYNIPFTMKMFSEVLIRYFDNNLIELGEEITKLKDISYKNIEFIKNSDNICDTDVVPILGTIEENDFKIIKDKYGFKVIGINDIDNDYQLIVTSNEKLNKLLNKIIKDYKIIINLDDYSNKLSLITKYTTYNNNNNYACEICSFESDDSNDFVMEHILEEKVDELYNTCCLCNKCAANLDDLTVKDRVRLLVNVRNRIKSRLEDYLDSFDKYVLIDNIDIIIYSLEDD